VSEVTRRAPEESGEQVEVDVEQAGVIVQLPDMVPTPDELPPEGCPVMAGPGDSENEVLYYWDYLHLDHLLNSQTPKSAERGGLVHDEIFFIVVHQTYELWFKQILVELDSVLDLMSADRIPERDLGVILSRLQRINSIQQLLVGQFDILETMTPLDFLDFRSMLLPASGFQSVQFRLIENKFGLLEKDRVRIEGHSYADTLRADHAALVVETENAPSLFDHLERWLARTPFVSTEDFDFITTYRNVAKAKHDATRATMQGHPDQLATFERGIRKFDALFDKAIWDDEMQQGSRRLSYEAFMAALFINLYRDEPILHMPYLILTALVDIDETFTMWRQRHALMAHRMLGRLTGTAGSGYDYLDETAKTYTPFRDLFDVATYLLPRSLLPRLPEALVSDLDFRNE
jgi:tryptophan 2,3-dioxygenase